MIQLLQVFLLAMTPIGELRAAIPVGLGIFHLNWFLVFIVSVVGNLVPVVFLLLFLEPISKLLSQNFKILNRFFFWLFERTKKRTPLGNKKYTLPALALFVAVPLPMTGAWTGAILAYLLGIPFKKSFLAIGAGVLGAGIIVILVAKAGIAIEKYFGWQTLVGILILIGIGAVTFKGLKIRKLNND